MSVVVVCHEQGPLLDGVLASIAGATRQLHEVVVVDDASQGRQTVAKLLRLAPQARHQRVVVDGLGRNSGNCGAPRNLGLRLATGSFIKFLDADDFLTPSSLDLQLSYLAGPKAQVGGTACIGGYRTVDATTGVLGPAVLPASLEDWSPSALYSRWEREISIPIHTAVFDRMLFANGGVRFPEEQASKEDYVFWVRAATILKKPLLLKRTVALYTVSPNSMSRRSAAMNALGWLQAVETLADEQPELRPLKQLNLDYFKDYYVHRLWAQYGPSLPWKIARELRSEGVEPT